MNRIGGICDNFKAFAFPLETHAHGPVLQFFFKGQQLINSYRRITQFFTNVFEKAYFQSLVV